MSTGMTFAFVLRPALPLASLLLRLLLARPWPAAAHLHPTSNCSSSSKGRRPITVVALLWLAWWMGGAVAPLSTQHWYRPLPLPLVLPLSVALPLPLALLLPLSLLLPLVLTEDGTQGSLGSRRGSGTRRRQPKT